MAETVNLLNVFIDNRRIGKLALSPDRRCLFEYDPGWIATGFSVSPFYLPLKSGLFTARAEPFGGMFGVFDDSLPDGWGKLLVDRWLISRGINPASLSLLERLSIVGENGMGALVYRPAKESSINEEVHPLSFYALEVEKILHDNYSGSLEELFHRAGSSGGARPKVLVKIDGKEWLVKFKASSDPVNVGSTEYEYSLLAKKCGIEMAETRLFEGKYFGVHRFDRQPGKRIHMHSAAGLLYASHRFPSMDYTDLLKATMVLTRNITEVEKIFRQMVFNILISNKDDHAKNFSFIYINGYWAVSPAYDLLPSDGFNGNHSTTVNGKGQPSLTDCEEVAKNISLPLKIAARIIAEVKENL
ncbi:MAG: type II toxin-antitoxin system HipA family toxin [Bacteroidales bacterium]|nr:type II toxin-antitoxin system HipA family toxin [Bacteroidales bacterium]